jgi:hypothetical protein
MEFRAHRWRQYNSKDIEIIIKSNENCEKNDPTRLLHFSLLLEHLQQRDL